jgi:plasmid stability protein
MTAIMNSVRQLITRLDDDLHLHLKAKARGAGKSMNAYVVDLLREAVNRDDAKARLRRRLQDEGRLVVPPVT